MATCLFEFTVILGNNERKCTLESCVDVFSVNSTEIFNLVSKLGGDNISSNTVRVFSNEAYAEIVGKLSSLT